MCVSSHQWMKTICNALSRIPPTLSLPTVVNSATEIPTPREQINTQEISNKLKIYLPVFGTSNWLIHVVVYVAVKPYLVHVSITTPKV